MSYLEELLPEFRKGAKIRATHWDKNSYIEIKNGEIVDCKGNDVGHLAFYKLMDNDWEFYQEPEPDWDYIIKNKCLCLFWNDDETAIGILKCKCTDGFLTNYGGIWNNCRPIHRYEVTFYEDKKDEI